MHENAIENASTIFSPWVHERFYEFIAVGSVEIVKLIVIALIFFIVHQVTHRLNLRYHKDNKHVSFSINYVENGCLKLRPIGREISISELFTNVVLRRAFIKATKRASRENPLLEFPLHLESVIMSTLQSYISDDFSAGFLRAASNLPTRAKTFIIMAAYEQYEDINVRKVRVIITHHDLIRKVPDVKDIKLEKPHQSKRLKTMELINRRYEYMYEDRKINYRVQIVFDCAPEDVKTPEIDSAASQTSAAL